MVHSFDMHASASYNYEIFKQLLPNYGRFAANLHIKTIRVFHWLTLYLYGYFCTEKSKILKRKNSRLNSCNELVVAFVTHVCLCVFTERCSFFKVCR